MTANAASAPPTSAGAAPIKVMIVDDSVFIRGLLSNWLSESGEFQVVASHANGRRAADDVQRAQPDLVILDLEMPQMDGLTALPLILERKAGTAVLVASALTRRGAEVSLRALTLGAADYIPKPDAARGVAAADEFRSELLAKARSLGARARRRGIPRPPIGPAAVSTAAPAAVASTTAFAPAPAVVASGPESAPATPRRMRPFSMMPVGILAIGSSTGGPQALTRLFADVGPYIGSIPVVLVQHMPATFTPILAEHIARASGRPCAEGRDGEAIRPGQIYVAPGGLHMKLVKENGQVLIRLNEEPPVNFCRPAVDPLFDSVAALYGTAALGVVLTGMGADGAKGAVRIADSGGSILAQDEESSVVWGMPGATFAAGACAAVLPIADIGRRVTRLVTGGRE
ncbi:protein-glutamate methylesterase/protein-glutamine glutaminase [Ancylobacter lacus]|uniref:protein-glutamate methylesterase/protein-glutamine glutaminase n=1 Tax=Ancylobacter lacus TaxID=2579970 RepID=UPI001BCD031C|nr:chemotaxis response regulator protein-glutamate methylesterase [Ancylobacter lacus]MBS7537973.1 chemotaxis response regulator protein-glutamate methylesterase [Ancylobacter lacus]